MTNFKATTIKENNSAQECPTGCKNGKCKKHVVIDYNLFSNQGIVEKLLMSSVKNIKVKYDQICCQCSENYHVADLFCRKNVSNMTVPTFIFNETYNYSIINTTEISNDNDAVKK
jgi:hypothetical protein